MRLINSSGTNTLKIQYNEAFDRIGKFNGVLEINRRLSCE